MKFDPDHALRIREVYDLLPSELASENRRFKMASVVPGSRFTRVEDGFLWLKNAGVAIPAYCVEEPKSPLKLSEKRNLFKLFSNDVGLLAAMYANGIQLRLLAGESGLNIGAVYENVIVLADTNYQIEEAFVLNNENLERIGRITYLPIYMVMFMSASELPEQLIYRV